MAKTTPKRLSLARRPPGRCPDCGIAGNWAITQEPRALRIYCPACQRSTKVHPCKPNDRAAQLLVFAEWSACARHELYRLCPACGRRRGQKVSAPPPGSPF